MIWDHYDSPLGRMRLCCDEEGLLAVVFEGQKYEQKHIPSDTAQGRHPILESTKLWLSLYFDGKIPNFLPSLKPRGSAFQLRVWEVLLQIPYRETITYGDLARKLNCKSAQAVGNAVGRNPISILIPCHRVVGADGKLTGYAGGVDKKKALLNVEQAGGIL